MNALAAVRQDLRSALLDLSDLLLQDGVVRHRALDAVRHAWILADLAELDHRQVHDLLHDLGAALRDDGGDRPYFANQLAIVADHV